MNHIIYLFPDLMAYYFVNSYSEGKHRLISIDDSAEAAHARMMSLARELAGDAFCGETTATSKLPQQAGVYIRVDEKNLDRIAVVRNEEVVVKGWVTSAKDLSEHPVAEFTVHSSELVNGFTRSAHDASLEEYRGLRDEALEQAGKLVNRNIVLESKCERVAQLQSELSSVRGVLRDVLAENEAYASCQQRMAKELQSYHNESEIRRKEVEELSAAAADASENLSRLVDTHAKLCAVECENVSLECRVRTLERELEAARKELAEANELIQKADELLETQETLVDKNIYLEQKIEGLLSEKSAFNEYMQAADQLSGEYEQQLEAHREENAALVTDIVGYTTEISTLKEEVKELSQQTTRLQTLADNCVCNRGKKSVGVSAKASDTITASYNCVVDELKDRFAKKTYPNTGQPFRQTGASPAPTTIPTPPPPPPLPYLPPLNNSLPSITPAPIAAPTGNIWTPFNSPVYNTSYFDIRSPSCTGFGHGISDIRPRFF